MQSFIPAPIYFTPVHPPLSSPPTNSYVYYPGQFTQDSAPNQASNQLPIGYPAYYQPQYVPYVVPTSTTPSAPPSNLSAHAYVDYQTSPSYPSHMSYVSSVSEAPTSSIKRNINMDEIEMKTLDSAKKSQPIVMNSNTPMSKNVNTVFATSPINSSVQSVSPAIEAFDIQQKKCRKCVKFYKEDQNAFDACRFHSGHYQSVYKSTLGMGSLNSWSCCKNYSRDAPGCKIGRHLECASTTAALKQFTQAMEMSEKMKEEEKLNLRRNKRTISSQSLIDLNDDFTELASSRSQSNSSAGASNSAGSSMYPSLYDSDSRFVKSGTEEYIKHNVIMTDTLSGLSIKYNVLVEEIKSINKLTKDEDVWTRFELLIPFKGQDVPGMDEKERKKCKQDMKNRLVKRFRRTTSCGENEARYYLKSSKWNIDEALKEFNDDIVWEKSNPPRQPLSKKL